MATAMITRPKRLSIGAAMLWALCLLIGLVLYLLVFILRRDPIGWLVVGDGGDVHGEWSDGAEHWPALPGDWACPRCAYPNLAQHAACTRCDVSRADASRDRCRDPES